MSKLVPEIILEGLRLTFKTEIGFELNEHPRIVGPRKYRYHSPKLLKDEFICEPRGQIDVISKRKLNTWFLVSKSA